MTAWLAKKRADRHHSELTRGASALCSCPLRLAPSAHTHVGLSHHGEWPQLSLKPPMRRLLAQLDAPVTRLLGHEAKDNPTPSVAGSWCLDGPWLTHAKHDRQRAECCSLSEQNGTEQNRTEHDQTEQMLHKEGLATFIRKQQNR
jgi:hypothetical protein